MKVLCVTDKRGSAIDRLANYVGKYSNDDIEVLPIHPKKESQEGLNKFKVLAEQADLIDFEYWKTAIMLLEKFPEFKEKPTILTHHNPYNLFEEDWDDWRFDCLVAKNQTQFKALKDAGYENVKYIKHAVDFDEYNFNVDREFSNKDVLMVAARIEGKKGIKEVAKACKELGLKFHLVGSVSDVNYFNELVSLNVFFHQDISNEELSKLYNECGLHVCNSRDGFESGTMPILESMASGLPVLTRNIGLVPDINNGKNIEIRYGKPDDEEELKSFIRRLINNEEKRKELSTEGYRSVTYYSAHLMAREYSRLFHEVAHKEPMISVIIPTVPERRENVAKVVGAYKYPNIEFLAMEDREGGYNLAKMRNLGAILAISDILVFNDDRFVPEAVGIKRMVERVAEKKWIFGNKDNARKNSFVENFSCILRRDFIDTGMCSERITEYGGMSQELRERFGRNGFDFDFHEDIRAKSVHGSASKFRRMPNINRMKTLLRIMYED